MMRKSLEGSVMRGGLKGRFEGEVRGKVVAGG